MKKLLSTLLSMAIFATLTTPAFAERELTVADGDLWNNLISYWKFNNNDFSDPINNNDGTVGYLIIVTAFPLGRYGTLTY